VSAPAPAASPATAPAAAPAASPAAKPAAFDEKAVADFFAGKTIRVISGLAPGTGGDVYARIFARHMPRFIPGSPNIIVENRTGAGGFLAANAVYNLEAKDGTVVSSWVEGNVLQQALGREGIEFDSGKMQWLGALADDRGTCAARSDTGVRSITEIMDGAGKPLIVAATAPGSTTFDIPTVLKAALGANFNIVSGYAGGPESVNAVLNKEADVYCVSFTSMVTTGARIVGGDNPPGRFIALLGSDRFDHPLIREIPPAETLAKTEEAKQMLRAVTAAGKMTYPFAYAPGVPSDRVAALRHALNQMVADPQFKEEVVRTRTFEWPTRSGESVAQVVDEVLATPPAVVAKLKDILK
jgi:tripartite-type tricarboxylate transporter receptor subunit TctC